MPAVTVIVPVRNEARSIEQTLRSLLTQDVPAGGQRWSAANAYALTCINN